MPGVLLLLWCVCRNGSGAAPLRDVVADLRAELQEKEGQLAQASRVPGPLLVPDSP
jgi:hypothetical protein